MKKLAMFVSSVLVLPLVGCSSEETSKNSENYQYAFSSDDIFTWFDIEIDLLNELPEAVGLSQLTVEFDLDGDGTFSDGDIRFKAGNVFSKKEYSYSRWPNDVDFYVETLQGSDVIRLYEDSTSGGVTNVYVNDIGGAWLYEKKEDGRVTQTTLGLRLNRGVVNEGEDANLKAVIDQVYKITPTTPIYVELTSDPASDEGVDYIPSKGVYSQHSDSTMSDVEHDYIGYKRWVDMTSVTYSHNKKN